jgi:hypothetical protein
MSLIPDTHKYYLAPSGATIKINGSFNSNLKYKLISPYHKNDKILYSTIRCVHAEIPYSFYIVNENNNRLVLGFQTITIPVGNYNANTFMTYINSQITNTVIMSFNTTTGKFSFTRTNGGSFNILATTTCSTLIGLQPNTAYASSGSVVNCPFLANFLGTRNLYIRLPELILDNFNPTTQDRSTLLNIPANVPPYSLILFDNRSNSSTIIKNDQIPEEVTLQIYDDDNKLINFNNADFNITLEITNYVLWEHMLSPLDNLDTSILEN